MAQRTEDPFQQRQEKLSRLRARAIDPYPPRYRRTHANGEALALLEGLERQAPPGTEVQTPSVRLAGRIIALRNMGRATFIDLLDSSGQIQVYLRRDLLGEGYQLLRDLDVGDFLGAEGKVFRTRTGEATLEAQEITLLAKALRPLPEKWHGLQDVEVRFRRRYLDLISSEETRRLFQLRSRIVSSVRRFLDSRGFLEVETPVLVPVPAGAAAQPFVTHHHALDQDLYLRIALELYLKRLIIGGLDKVYELGRVFRNEGVDHDHNPEFTILETYEAYADYHDVMAMVETLVSTVAQEVIGTTTVQSGQESIQLAPPWPRLSLLEELERRSGIDVEQYQDAAALEKKMRSLGLEVLPGASRGRLMDKLISATVEPHLIQPTFLVDYPVEMSPLAKQKPDSPRLVERFEAFAAGMEIANAFTELNDPLAQRERMEAQERLKLEHGNEELDRMDEDYLYALEHGMPPTGGLGIGIDRLVMLLTGQRSIREVVLFPQLRTL